jgi:hypothetical protein
MISVFVKFLHGEVNLNQSCGIDAFLIKSCPDVIQAFSLTATKIEYKYILDTDDKCVDLTYFISEFFL